MAAARGRTFLSNESPRSWHSWYAWAESWWRETTDVLTFNSPWVCRRSGKAMRGACIVFHLVQWCIQWQVWLDFWDWVYLPQGTFVLMWYLLVASLWTMATDVERPSYSSMFALAITLSSWLMAIITATLFLPGLFLEIFVVLCHSNVHPLVLFLQATCNQLTWFGLVGSQDLHISFNTVVGIYLLVAQCLLLMAYSWDFTKRIKALTSIGVATDPDWASPLTGRSARCFCWILAGNQWLWWMVLTLVKRHHQLCSWYFGLCDNHLTWTALLVACVLLLFVPFWVAARETCSALQSDIAMAIASFSPAALSLYEMVMFAIQHGDQEHEFGQTRYLFSHAVSTLCSFTMSSFLVAQQTLVQAGCNPRVCEAFLGLLTVVLLVLRPWHLPRVLRRMEFNVFFTFGFLWIIELSHSLDHFLRHRALLALKEGTEGCEVEMGTTGEAETRLEPTGA